MAACEKCLALADALKDVPAHSDLELVTSHGWRGGMAKGAVNHYKCKACGSLLSCDTDKHDAFAGWMLKQRG